MPSVPPQTLRAQPTEAVTGVQLAQGIGVAEAKGFWADAWAQVLTRRPAAAALGWLSIVAFFAVFAPFLASGHPVVMRELDASGAVVRTTSPLFEHLRAADLILVIGVPLAAAWIVPSRRDRASRLGACIFGGVLAAAIVLIVSMVQGTISVREPSGWALWLRQHKSAAIIVPSLISALVLGASVFVPAIGGLPRRLLVCVSACLLAGAATGITWNRPLQSFSSYTADEQNGRIQATYTVIPWSPGQRFSALDRLPPGTTLGQGLKLGAGTPGARRTFLLGTDALGQDVLSQLLHACRLSISIGLVSTGIAVLIGVTMGALMGYFGGMVDLLLYRVVEVFMAVPLLFLLIVAAAVLDEQMRTTYTMMAIIGCFTWTGAARFTRAEFLKLRSQDFVQSAKAVGLPLRSILFKHMLPNGVTPVLVDASFAIAAAITIEATLSFLGLGPVDQASWGKLLSSATSAEGEFKWWLAIFPGLAIFLTVLSYNLIGEALRDAIDPKLKKARV